MRTLHLDLPSCPTELRAGLAEIKAHRPREFHRSGESRAVRFVKSARAETRRLAGRHADGEVVVEYARKVDAFRALGRLLGQTAPADFVETPRFTMLGVMVDVSRNGVLRPDVAKAMLRRFALMGLDTFLLYTEDTYEVPGEPFFGYLRGAYSHEELAELDRYADMLGIEMFPCIETLGHMEQVLQWPAYADLQDVPGVLLVDEERTYALLEKMLHAASAPFRSQRIHLGLDEAHGLGSGRYRDRHGERDRFDIFLRHLDRLRGMCRQLGLHPLMWSDMYFRLGSRTNDYYDPAAAIPPAVRERVPGDVELVYWDYYHTDAAFYGDWIARHRELGGEPVMAGGVWTWNRFWAALPFSLTTTRACMDACKSSGVKQTFVTLWGDDGMECDPLSALPGVCYFAEHGHSDVVDERLLRDNFRGMCEAEFDDYVLASGLDSIPPVGDPGLSSSNVGKALLWQDPLLGLMDPQLGKTSLRPHYSHLDHALHEAAQRDAIGRLRLPAQAARVLALKCDLHFSLAAAYASGHKKKLRALQHDLKTLRTEVDGLWKLHREIWMATFKPFGWEVVEHRYGGLRARLESLEDRLAEYMEERVSSLPELDAPRHKVWNAPVKALSYVEHRRMKTPSAIK